MNRDVKRIGKNEQIALRFLIDNIKSKAVYVGGVADYINLRSHKEMRIKDIDIIVNYRDCLKPLYDNYHMAYKDNITYPGISKEYYICDFPPAKWVRMDIFIADTKDIDIVHKKILGEMVKCASPSYMYSFHAREVQRLTGNESYLDFRDRIEKHRKKAVAYLEVYSNLKLVEIDFEKYATDPYLQK